MCRPGDPQHNFTFNVSKWPSLSLTLKTDFLQPRLPPSLHTHSHTLSETHGLSPNTLSKAVPVPAEPRNPICTEEAWAGQMKLVVTLQREAVNHTVRTVCEGESSEDRRTCLCVRVCVFPGRALTARALSDAAVLSVPVPEQQGGVSGARQNVAVAADVRLGAGEAGHHVPMPEHDLRQLPCRRQKENNIKKNI